MKGYQKTYKNNKRQSITNSESQRVFFECVKIPHLSEFLYRVTEGTFDNDIINSIIDDGTYNPPNDLQIRSEIGSTKSNKPSLYTKIYYDNTEQAHLTLHFCPDNFNKRRNGPIHIRNIIQSKIEDKRVSQRLSLTRKSDGSIEFLLGSSQYSKMKLRPEINKIASYILHVLNSYFYVKSPNYVGIAKHSLTNHPLINTISQIRQNISNSQLQKTRRRSRH